MEILNMLPILDQFDYAFFILPYESATYCNHLVSWIFIYLSVAQAQLFCSKQNILVIIQKLEKVHIIIARL